MMYKFLYPLLFLPLSFCSSFAQNNRSANDAEKTVINKAVNIIVPIVDGFENDTWQKEGGGADAPEDYSVQRHPNIPVNVAPFNDWHLSIRQSSDYYNKVIKPYYEKVSNGLNVNDTKAIEAIQKEGQKIKYESNLYIEVHLNDAAIPVKPLK
ncbi:MAG: hypothetical protein ACRDE5_06430, partial [Ginsengibacter sp.]